MNCWIIIFNQLKRTKDIGRYNGITLFNQSGESGETKCHIVNTQNGITPFILKSGTNQQKNTSILAQYAGIKVIVRLLKRKAFAR